MIRLKRIILKPVFIVAIVIVTMIGVMIPNVFSEELKKIQVNSGIINTNDFLYKPFDIMTEDLKRNSFECADDTVSVTTNKQSYNLEDVVTLKVKVTSESNENRIKLKIPIAEIHQYCRTLSII